MAIGSRNKSRRQAQRDGLRSRRCHACDRYKRALQFPQRDPKHCVECYGKLDKGLLLTASRQAMAEMLCNSALFHLYMDELAMSKLNDDQLSAMMRTPSNQRARNAIFQYCEIESFTGLKCGYGKPGAMFDHIKCGYNKWLRKHQSKGGSFLWR